MPEESTRHRRSLADASRYLLAHPIEILLLRWNWKASLLSCLFRGAIFFGVNLVAGFDSAVNAMLTEMVYRIAVTGIFASLGQWYRLVEPAWKGALMVMGITVGLNQALSLAVHWYFGTTKLALSLLVSSLVTAASAWFQFFIMRQGVFIVEPGAESFWMDLVRFPRAFTNLLLAFRTSPPAKQSDEVRG